MADEQENRNAVYNRLEGNGGTNKDGTAWRSVAVAATKSDRRSCGGIYRGPQHKMFQFHVSLGTIIKSRNIAHEGCMNARASSS